jgi:hypothetical protein
MMTRALLADGGVSLPGHVRVPKAVCIITLQEQAGKQKCGFKWKIALI